MLRKVQTTCSQYQNSLVPILITVNSPEDLEQAIAILKNHDHKCRGISIDSELLKHIDPQKTNINYYRIHLTNKQDLIELKKFSARKEFIEIFIPHQLFSQQILQDYEMIKRIIIVFDKQEQTNHLKELFATLISKRKYPFTKGIPFCHINIQHAIEIFEPQEQNEMNKPSQCSPCIFKAYCPKKINDNFTTNAITNKAQYKELLTFLEVRTNEDSSARF